MYLYILFQFVFIVLVLPGLVIFRFLVLKKILKKEDEREKYVPFVPLILSCCVSILKSHLSTNLIGEIGPKGIGKKDKEEREMSSYQLPTKAHKIYTYIFIIPQRYFSVV